ncbi:MAG TPA: DUF308 domain-containing protein [Nitrososphaera sp.]|jgi:uncharacterized membrane protein HdeD (DUF308 family)
MRQESIKAPKYVRTIDVILGVISLILAGIVFATPAFAEALLVLVISLSLIFAGVEGIIVGATGRGLSGGQRALRLILGIIAVGLSIAVIAFPGTAVLSSVLLLSIGLLALGAAAIGKGITEKFMPNWARAMYVAVGGIVVALSIPVIVYPVFGLLTLYYMIAGVLIINGVGYIIAGITGAVYVPIGTSIVREGRKWESDAA